MTRDGAGVLSVERQGPEPQTHGSDRAHLDKEKGSGAVRHMAACGSTPRSLS
jgi:hypothetical protein